MKRSPFSPCRRFLARLFAEKFFETEIGERMKIALSHGGNGARIWQKKRGKLRIKLCATLVRARALIDNRPKITQKS
jgi:hypothetical protein